MFLTALDSGRRRSEIHVLSFSDVQFTDQSVDLLTFPGFLAKNQLPSVLGDPISLPSKIVLRQVGIRGNGANAYALVPCQLRLSASVTYALGSST